jgi:hypothetical protein
VSERLASAHTPDRSAFAGVLGLIGVALFAVATMVPFAAGDYPERRLAPSGPEAAYGLVTTHLLIPASLALGAIASVALLRGRRVLAAGILVGVGLVLGVSFVQVAISFWATGGFAPGGLLWPAAAVTMVVGGVLGRPPAAVAREESLPAALAVGAGALGIAIGSVLPYIVQRGGSPQAMVSLEFALRGSFGHRVGALALIALLATAGVLAVRLARGTSGRFLGPVLAGIGILQATYAVGWLVFTLRSSEFDPWVGSYLVIGGGVMLALGGIASVRGSTSGSGGDGPREPRRDASPVS